MAFFGKTARARRATTIGKPVNLGVEALESRLTPYALSGNAWIRPELITISFVPDGTILGTDSSGNITSNLQSSFNTRFGNAATWQNQILKAAQQWAAQTNINFKVVSDNGAEIGTGAYQQGDANYGDIRIGGYNFGTTTLAQSYSPPPDNGTSYAGDIQFNTGQTWNVGTTYDLYTVALHEIGHSLGLYHGNSGAAMYGTYGSVLSALQPDDIAGAQAVVGWTDGTFTSPGYGGARANDSYDAAAANGSFAAASTITSTINTTTKTALLASLDIKSSTDSDYYKFVVPAGLGGTMTLKVQSTNLSFLAPTLTLYNGSQAQLSTQSASTTDYDGTTLSTTYSVSAGQTYYVKVTGVNTTAFGTGRYALALGFAGVAAPTAASPNTQTANDPNGNAGGGQAVGLGPELRVNSYTTGTQITASQSMRTVAMDGAGNFVVVWISDGQDGSGTGIYAQRYNASGNKVGSEFRANTYTTSYQTNPSVTMNASGAFLITWQSYEQDGSDYGIYAQRYNSSGVAQGSEFRVNTTTTGAQASPTAAMDANGNFVITWTSYVQGGPFHGIKAQRYNSSGVAQGGELSINQTSGTQYFPMVSMDASGNFVAVWQHTSGSGWDILARRFSASGTALGNEFQINASSVLDHQYPSVAVDTAGRFVVAWTGPDDIYGGSGDGVLARRFDATGTALGSEFLVNTNKMYLQWRPSVAIAAGGNFFVTWESSAQDGSGFGVYAQQYTASGVRQGLEFRVNTTTSGEQQYSSMAMNGNGSAVIVWSGNGSGDTSGVFAQRYMVSYNGLNPMQASEPHGYNPDGCLEHDHSHDHASDEGDGGTSVGSAGENPPGSLPTSAVDRNFLFGLITRRRDEVTPRREQDPTRSRSNEANPQETRVSTMGRRNETPLQANARRSPGSASTISDPITKGV